MKEYTFHYNFSPIPPFLQKGRQVVIVLRNNEGKFILGAKHRYPKDIYRFVGGGAESEIYEDAAVRELQEELGIEVKVNELQPLAEFTVHITDDHEEVDFELMMFLLNLKNEELHPSSDLDGLVTLTKQEVLELAERYKKLPSELVDLGGEKSGPFRWNDYGTFMSEVHRIAMELTLE